MRPVGKRNAEICGDPIRTRRGVGARLLIALTCIGCMGAFYVPSAGAGAPRRVLDETGYLRAWLRFERDRVDGDLMRAQAAEILGDTHVNRLRRSLRGTLREQGIEDAEAWADHVEIIYLRRGYHTLNDYPITPMSMPPAEWTDAAFDDGDWTRRRMPLQVGRDNPAGGPRQSWVHLRQAFYRARFDVADAQRDGPYTLTLNYRGGIRVWINGTELARGHLPEGDLADDTLAHPYPLDAYLRRRDEFTEEEVAANKARNNGTYNPYDQPIVFDVPVRYEEAGEAVGEGRYRSIDADVWNRLYEARERTLGPVTIPPDLLRPGANVLAIELRRAPIHPVVLTDETNLWFPHLRVSSFELLAAGAGAPSALEPAEGMQVWAQNPTSRLYERDFLERGGAPGGIRMVGARNGIFAGQLVVRADHAISGLAVSIGELRHAEGAHVIPAHAATFQGVLPVPRRGRLPNTIARLEGNRTNCEAALTRLLNHRYGEGGADMGIYAMLTDDVPDAIPAQTPQPVHLNLHIPADTVPGEYRGAVRVATDGTPPVDLPVTVEVHDWHVPAPADFKTHVGIIQDARGMLRHGNAYHNTPLWSERHLALIASSFRQMARLGADWIDVPVIETAAFIRWTRGRDGELRFDFSNLDRYLDIALDSGINPRVINFHIMESRQYPRDFPIASKVPIRDEATGETETIELGPGADPAMRRAYWTAFALATHAYMEGRGLAHRMYWGTPLDRNYDPEQVQMLREILPDVQWSRWAHLHQPDDTYRAMSTLYPANPVSDEQHTNFEGMAADLPLPGLRSAMGWNGRYYHVASSRGASTVHMMGGGFPPLPFRLYADRAIAAGRSGIGVMSADNRNPGLGVSVGIGRLFWQGEDALLSGTHVEMLREGLQETEARIFIEQALLRGDLPEALAREAMDALNRNLLESGYVTRGAGVMGFGVQDHDQGWQLRSRRLFQAAARVAREVGIRPATQQETVTGVASGHAVFTVQLQSWASGEEQWRLHANVPWLRPHATEGSLTLRESVDVEVDLTAAVADTVREGIVELTDVGRNRKLAIPVTVTVKAPLSLEGVGRTAYVKPGEPRTYPMRLVNHTGEERTWRARPSDDWITLDPAGGSLNPGAGQLVRLRLAPPHRDAAAVQASITFNDQPPTPLRVFVDTAEGPPPAGEPVHLVDLDHLLHAHYTLENPRRGIPSQVPRSEKHLHARPMPGYKSEPNYTDEIVYNVGDSDFDVFAATVAFLPSRDGNRSGRGRFQVITDGQVRFDTGFITPGDATFPVVIRHLEHADKLTLLFTREDASHGDEPWWRDARLYRQPQP